MGGRYDFRWPRFRQKCVRARYICVRACMSWVGRATRWRRRQFSRKPLLAMRRSLLLRKLRVACVAALQRTAVGGFLRMLCLLGLLPGSNDGRDVYMMFPSPSFCVCRSCSGPSCARTVRVGRGRGASRGACRWSRLPNGCRRFSRCRRGGVVRVEEGFKLDLECYGWTRGCLKRHGGGGVGDTWK